jgi:hypothetical protein
MFTKVLAIYLAPAFAGNLALGVTALGRGFAGCLANAYADTLTARLLSAILANAFAAALTARCFSAGLALASLAGILAVTWLTAILTTVVTATVLRPQVRGRQRQGEAKAGQRPEEPAAGRGKIFARCVKRFLAEFQTFRFSIFAHALAPSEALPAPHNSATAWLPTAGVCPAPFRLPASTFAGAARFAGARLDASENPYSGSTLIHCSASVVWIRVVAQNTEFTSAMSPDRA